jgi:hypothetical protein
MIWSPPGAPVQLLRRLFLLTSVAACGGPSAPPTLDLRVPSSIAAGKPITLKATATTGDGKIGKGTVKFSSPTGAFVDGEEATIDSFGTASVTFSCEPECTAGNTFLITARWTSNGVTADATGRTTVPGVGSSTDAGTSAPVSAQTYLSTCVARARPQPDDVTVNGTVGALGNVSIRIRNGLSAGVAFREAGGQFFTSGMLTGTPTTVESTGLWMWPSTPVVQVGVLYEETNAASTGLAARAHSS